MTKQEYAKSKGIKLINAGNEELTNEDKAFIDAISRSTKKDYFASKDKAPNDKTKKRKRRW